MGNALSNFWQRLVGGLGGATQNAANSFISNTSQQQGNTPVQPKPMGINLNPSTISISQGDVQGVSNGLLNTIRKYGTSYLANSGFGQNPILGAGLTYAQSLMNGGQNQQTQTNTQAGVQNTNLNGTIQDTLGHNTSNYGTNFTSLTPTTNTTTTTNTGNSNTTPTSNFNINDLPQSQQASYTTPEGQAYLNSLNGYQNQILKFYSQADETHNHELSQINAEMQNIKNKQEQENLYQAEAARQSGISTGLAFLTPQLYQNAIKNTIDTGIAKIADITVKQNGLILEADKASLSEKRQILGQLQELQQQKFQAARTMKEDFMKQKQFEDQQHETVINSNLPAIYEQAQKLPPAEQGAFIAQAAQRMGVPITQLASSYRQFGVNENKNISAIYNQIAEKLATTNPQLALEIAQKSLTPEGRQELMNSPYFKALSALGSLGGALGGFATPVTGPIDWNKLSNAISINESGGNYKSRGIIVQSGMYAGQSALGKYQVMPGNLDEFSRLANKAFGTPILGNNPKDIQTFLNSPQIQDQIFQAKMQQLIDNNGGRIDAGIAAWFGGQGGADAYLSGTANNISDGLTKLPAYVQKAIGNYTGGVQQGQQPNAQQALQLAKQNLQTLGGTKINIGQIAGINNPSTLWTKATLLLPTAEEKKSATAALKMTLVAQKLQELRSTVGEENFGLLASGQQSLKQIYGGTNGQQVSRLVTEITSLLQQNRSDITGAAWGSKEDKEYLMKLPNQRDSASSYFGKLEGLLDSAYIDSRSTIGSAIGGEDIFDALYGNQFKLDSVGSNGQKQSLNNIFGF